MILFRALSRFRALFDGDGPSALNRDATVLGNMPDFFQKHVWITRHAIPFAQRPG